MDEEKNKQTDEPIAPNNKKFIKRRLTVMDHDGDGDGGPGSASSLVFINNYGYATNVSIKIPPWETMCTRNLHPQQFASKLTTVDYMQHRDIMKR